MDITTLAQHILDTHHALLHAELPRLTQAFAGDDIPDVVRRPWNELAALLEMHLMKEERILFPAIFAQARGEPLPPCGLEGPIRQMQYEHKMIEELEARLRGVLNQAGPEASALEALLDDLAIHAGREDRELFPAALAAQR